MPISDFARYPLTFGPSPVHRLDRLTAHLGGAEIWAKREDCNAGPGLRRQQDPQARVPRPRRARPGRRHPGQHRRRTSPTTPARSPRSRRKLGLKAVLVQENWVDWPDCVNDRVGNILLSRIMGAEVRLDPAGFGIGFKDCWQRGARGRRGARRHAVRHPGRRLRPPPRRARLRATGPTRSRQQEQRARRLLRHHRGLQRHRLHPRRDDRRLRRAGPAAPGDRHRRLRQARRDPRPGRPDRPPHRGADRPRPRPARRRDHGARGLGRRPLRHPGRSRRSTRSGSPASSRA